MVDLKKARQDFSVLCGILENYIDEFEEEDLETIHTIDFKNIRAALNNSKKEDFE